MKKLINMARGLQPADFVIKNANLVNVLSGEIYPADIAISDGIIVGVGQSYNGATELDAHGAYVCPSFMDGHVHLESSMMHPAQFANAVLPCGTTTVMTDPHEIANVLGLDGIKFMMAATENIDMDAYFMLSSCVPATAFETSGYTLSADDLETLMDNPRVLGLAEMMNYVGTVNADDDILAKLNMTKKHNKKLDGHAPMLGGKDLCAYIVTGIKSDHECTTLAEATEKLRQGMYIMIREGSAAKDLDALMPLLKNENTRKCMFVTDDRHPTELDEHINGMVRRCVEGGVDPITAIQCASLNTAEYFGLYNLGAIAPGYRADMLILPDLKTFAPEYVIKNGKIVAQNGRLVGVPHKPSISKPKNTMNAGKISVQDFQLTAKSDTVKTIQIIPHKLITKNILSKIKIVDNQAVSNIEKDILKISVIERHHATGNIATGFVNGFKLKSGAIASTVAHDSHNLIVVGTNDADMCLAAQELINCGGGKIVVNNGQVMAKLALPIAGLMSDKSFADVKHDCQNLKSAAQQLGSELEDPFMAMAFLSLSVIPELKITDKGIFSTETFDFVDIFA